MIRHPIAFAFVACVIDIETTHVPTQKGPQVSRGRKQEAGGWNRLALDVDDLPSAVAALKKAVVRF